MSKKNKNLMDDPNYRNFEWGKVDLASEVNKLLDESLKENINIKDFAKKFKKEYAPYIASYGSKKPTKFELKFNYWKTYNYRGFKVKIFDDDYGQQYYFYFKGKCIGCGAYNFDWEGCVQYGVDHYWDEIYDVSNLDKKYLGAYLQYNNHEHTEILFTYRMEEAGLFYPKEDGTFDIEDIKKQCVDGLEHLFASKEFQESEAQRKANGNLYFSEMLEQMEKEENESK